MNEYRGFDENLSLNGKVAVVTGGASGIGNAAAKMMKRKGADVVQFDLAESVKEAAQEMGAVAYALDITKPEQVQKAVDQIIEEKGKIDILCNIAGLGSGTPADEISEQEFVSVINVNLCGAFSYRRLWDER